MISGVTGGESNTPPYFKIRSAPAAPVGSLAAAGGNSDLVLPKNMVLNCLHGVGSLERGIIDTRFLSAAVLSQG